MNRGTSVNIINRKSIHLKGDQRIVDKYIKNILIEFGFIFTMD